MSPRVLAIRVSRRALAVAMIDDEQLAFRDGRHLSSNVERAAKTTDRYVRQILELAKPTKVILDVPMPAGRITERLLLAIHGAVAATALTAQSVTARNVLASYGVRALRSRIELVRMANDLWPELVDARRGLKPYLVAAAATALYEEVQLQLGPPRPT
jgi:hypothetical protein